MDDPLEALLKEGPTCFRPIIASDEVGRGPLAGPVVSCSVLAEFSLLNSSIDFWQSYRKLDQYLRGLGVTDSKKLTEKKRKKILEELNLKNLGHRRVYGPTNIQKFEINYKIDLKSSSYIDENNILNASLDSMFCGIKLLSKKIKDSKSTPLILIDGNRVPKKIEGIGTAMPVVKGDMRNCLIGLASIIAKEFRDELMKKMGQQHPGYGFEHHAGYPTKTHKKAIRQQGPCPIHRKTFKGVKEFVELQ